MDSKVKPLQFVRIPPTERTNGSSVLTMRTMGEYKGSERLQFWKIESGQTRIAPSVKVIVTRDC